MFKRWILGICFGMCVALCLLGCEKEQAQERLHPTKFEAEDPTRIRTPYMEIRLPEQWRQMLRCEILQENNRYTLTFYGHVDGKEEIRLFDLIFGQSDAYRLGTLMQQGEEVGVYVESYDMDIDETWSEQQRYDILGMENQINTILQQLMTMDNFIISQ